MTFRFSSLLYGFLAILWGCVPANYSGGVSGTGIGGTGQIATSGTGIGGTGQVATSGTGIGSTSTMAGEDGDHLGIIGSITGFGSIWVNGLEVEFDSLTPITTDGTKATAQDLAKGQVVEVLANNRKGEVRAVSITMRYEVVGPVQSISVDPNNIQVMGQQVILTPDTILPETWIAGPSTGGVVRVSGFRDGQGRVLASRIETGTDNEPAVLIGLTNVTTDSITVAGLPVNLPLGVIPISSGEIVRVNGRLLDGALVVNTLRRDSAATFFGGTIDRFLIQAIPVSKGANDIYHLGGLPFQLSNPDTVPAAPSTGPLLFMGIMDAKGEMRLQQIPSIPTMGQRSFPMTPVGQRLMNQRLPDHSQMSISRPGVMDRGGNMGR